MIKVLLVTNLVFKDEYVTSKSNANFGGWLTSIAYGLNDSQISVGLVCREGSKSYMGQLENIKYYCLNYEMEDFNFNEIINDFKPDIIQCEGTEYPHNSYLINNIDTPIVLSLQGILFGINNYYMSSLIKSSLVSISSPLSIVNYLAIYINYLLSFRKRIKPELEIMSKSKINLGRTDWDQAYSKYLSPNAKYYSIKRIIREEFHKKKWKGNISSHSIYISNCSRPLKGFHTLIESIAILKNEFPKIKVYVAGPNPFEKRGLKGYFDYMNLVKQYIIKHDLTDVFVFLSELNADEVSSLMSEVSCSIIPSFIENSPNSLVESMFLGVPTISSYAGGVGSMLINDVNGLLFRAGDKIMLADKIREIFTDEDLARSLSKNSYSYARLNHNTNKIIQEYIKLYKMILQK